MRVGGLPTEYTNLQLCRDVYRCLPSELAEERWADISLHIKMMNAESKVRR